jgi:hypothetical protein
VTLNLRLPGRGAQLPPIPLITAASDNNALAAVACMNHWPARGFLAGLPRFVSFATKLTRQIFDKYQMVKCGMRIAMP